MRIIDKECPLYKVRPESLHDITLKKKTKKNKNKKKTTQKLYYTSKFCQNLQACLKRPINRLHFNLNISITIPYSDLSLYPLYLN